MKQEPDHSISIERQPVNFNEGLQTDKQPIAPMHGDTLHCDREQREDQLVQDAILAGYRDLAAGRLFESSGDFESDMARLARKEADGWR